MTITALPVPGPTARSPTDTNARRGLFSYQPGEIDDLKIVVGSADEPLKVGAGDCRRGCVDEGMEVDRFESHQRSIGDEPNLSLRIIHQGERGHRARGDAEHLLKLVPRGEGQTPGPQAAMQGIQSELVVGPGRDQDQLTGFVGHEEVFAVPPRQRGFQIASFCHGEGGRVLDRPVTDAVEVKKSEQV